MGVIELVVAGVLEDPGHLGHGRRQQRGGLRPTQKQNSGVGDGPLAQKPGLVEESAIVPGGELLGLVWMLDLKLLYYLKLDKNHHHQQQLISYKLLCSKHHHL